MRYKANVGICDYCDAIYHCNHCYGQNDECCRKCEAIKDNAEPFDPFIDAGYMGDGLA